MASFGSYCLTADIDASTTAAWNGGKGFTPISSFAGILDGQGHVIRNLTINRSTISTPTGLIGTLSGGQVLNLGLLNASITGKGDTGGLIGDIARGTLDSSFTTGTIQSTGILDDGTGGLVGRLVRGTVSNSYSSAAISAAAVTEVGGLAGFNVAGTMNGDFSDATVNGGSNSDVGGVVGYTGGTVENAFNEGPVSGAGGLIGGLAAVVGGGTVTDTYSVGPVTGGTVAGLLIGAVLSGTVSNSFWDIDINPALPGIGQNLAPDFTTEVVGYPDSQMRDELNFSEFGWDFTQTWGIVEGTTYPFLLALTTRGVTVRGDYCARGGASCVQRFPPAGQPATGPGWTFADVEVQTLATSTSPQPFHAHLECRSVYASGGSLYQDVGVVDTSPPGSTLSGNLVVLNHQAIVTTNATSTLSTINALPDPPAPFTATAVVTGAASVDPSGNNGAGRVLSGLFRLTITGNILTYVWDGSSWQYSATKPNASMSCLAGSGINVLHDQGLSQSTPTKDAAQIRAR
jgi:hypothetical protein